MEELITPLCSSLLVTSVFTSSPNFSSSRQVCPELAAMYYGKPLGDFPPGSQHRVSGSVKVADAKTLVIENFVYDGTAPGT